MFADSTQSTACPEDGSSERGEGVRFHGARAGEASDTVQALEARRRVTSSLTTLLSYDYKAKRAVVGSAPARQPPAALPPLESYDVPGQYAYADSALAQHYGVLQMEAQEARARAWHGRSTVRTLAAGTKLRITQGPLAVGTELFTVVRVISVGVNNLPTPAGGAGRAVRAIAGTAGGSACAGRQCYASRPGAGDRPGHHERVRQRV
nr:contractile injection system protein, VgrG/Pvc8 family [Pseudoduganella plicata]